MNDNQKSPLRYRTYQFSLSIINFCATLPNQRIYWVICDQLIRSATSVGANVIEAKASSSKKDFIRFYEIALKSANETLYWLGLLKDSDLSVDTEKVNRLIDELEEICKMLGKSLITMKGKS